MTERLLSWGVLYDKPAKDIREWPQALVSASYAALDRSMKFIDEKYGPHEIIEMDVCCIYRGENLFQYLRHWKVRAIEPGITNNRLEGS